MDRRTIVLVAICLALFLGYPFILRFLGLGQYLGPPPSKAPDTTQVAVRDTAAVPSPTASTVPATAPAAADSSAGTQPQQVVTVDNALYRAWFSTRGART